MHKMSTWLQLISETSLGRWTPGILIKQAVTAVLVDAAQYKVVTDSDSERVKPQNCVTGGYAPGTRCPTRTSLWQWFAVPYPGIANHAETRAEYRRSCLLGGIRNKKEGLSDSLNVSDSSWFIIGKLYWALHIVCGTFCISNLPSAAFVD